MSRLIQFEVFKYEELSEKAKDVARSWYREDGFGYEWWKYLYEEFKALAEDLGIEIKDIFFRLAYTQGDGASFTGSFDLAKVDMNEAMKHQFCDETLERLIIDFDHLSRISGQSCSGNIHSYGRDSHEYSNIINVEFSLDLDEGQVFIITRDVTKTLRSLMKWMYSKLQAEYEYITSDKAVAELLNDNGYEFTVEGKRAMHI